MITLPVAILFVGLSGMATEGGEKLSAYIFMGAAFTYPISILIAFLCRNKLPALVFLPCLNVAVWLISGSS